MPKQTFYKLPEQKRKAFLLEAYKEFALHSYEAASITNLVKSLGIAKGSVYQYFKDKEDLYRFLVFEAFTQLNQLLDKACPNNGETFFDWYTKLLMVEVKFYLSFPQFAVLFQKLFAESENSRNKIGQEIEENWLDRINANLPAKFYNSPITNKMLLISPLQVFTLVTSKLNLNQIIQDEDVIFLETQELVSVCSEWIKKLKDGL